MRQLRFLVVDDTEDMRDVMVRIVERTGHVAEVAADGVEATVALSANRYDVMLLDLLMPRMSGEDVVRWLHAHPDRAEGLRVVVVSAWAGDRRGTLQELGITTVLAKPFRLQQMTDLIGEISAEGCSRSAADRSTPPAGLAPSSYRGGDGGLSQVCEDLDREVRERG